MTVCLQNWTKLLSFPFFWEKNTKWTELGISSKPTKVLEIADL